ncbi:alpha/beta hydrolase [Kineococcus indalonis]|uniref:alpha/beta hydrolase n=1 Tax=Kineococcus indalonis TaxID=2696566 RepID=UPI001412A3F5|nr:alpha/beta hydrolase fold domain-containing protein [Kineococcus indalonis]NAZ87432.1 alpha/beta hydrolase fold domain-containing protein [Kineococcus indalonis]
MQRLNPLTLGEHDAEDASILFEDPDHPGDERMLRNVTVPTLTPYLPAAGTATGTGVVVAPGGALHLLAVDNEGAHVAQLLTDHGIAAFVLHYRLAPTPAEDAQFAAFAQRRFGDREFLAETSRARRAAAAADGAAALRTVREHAEQWGVDPGRTGLLGFSAGAYVALATTFDAPTAERPSFLAPVYPAWWDEVALPQPVPPAFLAWASDDGLGDVIIGSCLRLYDAWRSAGVPVEAHAYAGGGHGFGVRAQGTPSDAWFATFLDWLAASGF